MLAAREGGCGVRPRCAGPDSTSAGLGASGGLLRGHPQFQPRPVLRQARGLRALPARAPVRSHTNTPRRGGIPGQGRKPTQQREHTLALPGRGEGALRGCAAQSRRGCPAPPAASARACAPWSASPTGSARAAKASGKRPGEQGTATRSLASPCFTSPGGFGVWGFPCLPVLTAPRAPPAHTPRTPHTEAGQGSPGELGPPCPGRCGV